MCVLERERERERERELVSWCFEPSQPCQRQRQTDRQTDKERERECAHRTLHALFLLVIFWGDSVTVDRTLNPQI